MNHPNKNKIINAALAVALKIGYHKMTRREVADRANLPPALIHYYFSGMPAIRKTVMREAIEREEPGIVAQGLALRDPIALTASKSLRKKAAQFLIDRT